MITQCATCGASIDGSGKCSRCSNAIPVTANGDATAVAGATAVVAMKEASKPRSTSPISRLSVTSAPDEGRLLAGTLIAGRYRIIGLLGRGGMGEVYRATDLTLAQSVALKFLPENAATNERILERFHNEVRVARQVSHPNVCRVYDIGEADGLPFISMEYVDGEDLGSLLARIGRLPSDKALEISRKLCAGLAAAHERGIIHRDLKPNNVMLNKRGEVVIMDFGLAALADQLDGIEARNGTPAYMSPEQLKGATVTAKSDIYSLGLIIYELFTGRRAFDANSMAELLQAEEQCQPPSIHSLAADVDPAVDKAVLHCLQPDPLHRPQSALSIAATLPGGDPLAAALAAGETPSPELVAASGKTEGFPLRYAAPCLAFVLLGIALYPYIEGPRSVLPLTPMDYPPAVLEQKAREMAAVAGFPNKPTDWNSRFFLNNDLLEYYKSRRGNRSWQQIFAAESPVQFSYRQSPNLLISPPDGTINGDRPPLTLPGMVSVQVDSRGRLRRFRSVVPRYGDSKPAFTLDMGAIFKLAGLDFARFHEVSPSYAPPLAFDTRRAWSGTHPDLPDLAMTVEVATWQGALTSMEIRWPWTQTTTTPEKTDFRTTALTIFSLGMAAIAVFAAIFFARRNIRLGRGDRKGSFRLALTLFLFYAVRWFSGVHMMPSFDLVDYGFEFLSYGLAFSCLLWLCYMALEPAVRARWPHSLITWNRLLSGQFGDARLGSHILIGSAIGVAWIYFFVWRTSVLMAGGGPPEDTNLQILSGIRPLVSDMSMMVFSAILYSTLVFFMLSGLRALVRQDWIAAIAAAVLMTFNEGILRHSQALVLDITLLVGIYIVMCMTLLRMGLIPIIVSIMTTNTLIKTPISFEFNCWYNGAAALLLAFPAILALYGFTRSQVGSAPQKLARAALARSRA